MKKDKKIIILVVCIIIILVAMISLFIANLNHKDDIDKTTTTTTTEKIEKDKTIKENSFNVSAIFDNFEYDDNVKLVVKKVDNVSIENVYDIELVNSNNNKIDVKNVNIQISIPFDNKDNYTNFKVLYLSENNEVLDTIDANYINGNVVFKTTHLSRYAIVANKVEEKPQQEQTTTKKTTTKKVTTKQTTTKKPVENTTTQPITKAPTTTTTTITQKVTTTQKVKTFTYKWSIEGDSSDRYYLYIVDDAGNKVNGSVTLTSKQSGSSKVVNITTEGKLLAKDLYTISNVKGN